MESIAHTSQENTRSLVVFFLHNFFISIGTILIYVCATVLLLQNNPDLSLPLGYFLAAVGCMGVGKLYEFFEHRYPLQKLIRRVMLIVVGIVILLSAGLYLAAPFVEAVVLMIGYRSIYLLSSLEFWGLSALVFDVRQSKRIFGIIGSGDLPAKAIGALLAVLIHSAYSLYILLWIASVAFLLAYLMQILTFRLTHVPDHHEVKHRKPASSQPRLIDSLFGGSKLVYFLCLVMVFISAAAIFIEYGFFFNVKHKYHDQGDVMNYIGYLLSMAFGAATLIKLFLSSRVIDRFGLRAILIFLPLVTVLASLGLYFSSFLTTSEVVLLNLFSGLYIFFEISRKATYDPVFLVMFQPLFLHQRLKAHTLAKGVYEPLGMAITGIITLVAYFNHLHFAAGSFLFIAAFALVAVYYSRKAYSQYLIELRNALSKRFFNENDFVFQHNAEKLIRENLESEVPSDVLFSINWMHTHQPATLGHYFEKLLRHPAGAVRERTLQLMIEAQASYDPQQLFELAQREEVPDLRLLYSQLACLQSSISEHQAMAFLNADDLEMVQGSTLSFQRKNQFELLTSSRLRYLSESSYESDQLAALTIIGKLRNPRFTTFISDSLKSPFPAVMERAIEVAASLPSADFCRVLYELTNDRRYDKQAVNALLAAGTLGEEWIGRIVRKGQPHLIHFVAVGCERIRTPATEAILVELASSDRFRSRTAALRSLTRLGGAPVAAQVLNKILQDEFDHIYQVLGGLREGRSEPFEASLSFEINESIRRIFYIFMLQHDAKMVENAMLHIEHNSREKRANAIEILDNIIPRNEYLALQALLEDKEPQEKIDVFSKTVTRQSVLQPSLDYILSAGDWRFSEWTLALALREFDSPDSSEMRLAYQDHPVSLIREAFDAKARERTIHLPNTTPMKSGHSAEAAVSSLEKIMVLKRTQLFENTPENVLSAIVPIMIEQHASPGEVLFGKGEIGNCMYVIYSGGVEIFDGDTLLAQFGSNDIFGELALLDAETRSASAIIVEESLLFRIDQEDFYDLMEERSELLKSVLSILCKRIRGQNDRLRRLEKAST